MSISKLRIGKDITIKMSILTNGEPVSLDGRDISVVLKTPMCQEVKLNFTIEDNIIISKYEGTKQKYCGIYMLTVWENYGKIGQSALDFCNAFELVSNTCKEVPTSEGLEIETITLEGDLSIGIQGASAYEVAVANGFKGTETEWLEWLKLHYNDLTAEEKAELQKPITDIAADVAEAERQRQQAEEIRRSAEVHRTGEEEKRVTAEDGRKTAEDARVTAETERVSAEVLRGEAEVIRAEAETSRVTAESKRSEAEAQRMTGEDLRKVAEQNRTTAEQARVSAEAERVKAESARVTAEQQRAEAEQARVTAEANRQQQTTAAIEAAKTATASATSATAEAAKAVTAATNATMEASEAAKLATDAASKTSTVDYAVCTTAATIADKEINIAGFALGTHCRFLVKMSHIAETEDVKLSVRSGDTLTEPKPLTFNGAPASVNNTWRAGDILDVYYDGSSFHATHYMGGYGITEINVSEMCPKGGHNGTNKFTLAEAIKKIPEAHQRIGFKCSFINDNNKLQTFVYQGNTWTDKANWLSCSGNTLHDIYLNAGATYNAQTERYELNGVDDITENEMLTIFRYTYQFGFYDARWFAFANSDIRTNFVPSNHWSSVRMTQLNVERLCANCKHLEVFRGYVSPLYPFEPSITMGMFSGCKKLRDAGYFNLMYAKNTSDINAMFQGCACLEKAYIMRLKCNISFADSPNLHYDCLKYLVKEATNDIPISVTVHPTTYDYLTGVAHPTEQVGGTSEEWQALVTLAAEKQITFIK